MGSSGLDLAVSTITDIPDPVAPGQPLKYTIVAVNGGTNAATNVHIEVTLPSSGVTFVNADGSPNADPFQGGAGHIDSTRVLDPGLVYNSGIKDWLGFLNGQGVDTGAPQAGTIAARDLNLPLVCTNDVHYLRDTDAHALEPVALEEHAVVVGHVALSGLRRGILGVHAGGPGPGHEGQQCGPDVLRVVPGGHRCGLDQPRALGLPQDLQGVREADRYGS